MLSCSLSLCSASVMVGSERTWTSERRVCVCFGDSKVPREKQKGGEVNNICVCCVQIRSISLGVMEGLGNAREHC